LLEDAKGKKRRVTMLPTSFVEELLLQLEIVKRLYQQDLEKGYGSVCLPFALERKYKNANREWIWQFGFSSDRILQALCSGIIRRYHLHKTGLHKALKQAVKTADIDK